MAEPVSVDIPHKLGRDTARARVDKGIGKISDWFPGGAVVDHAWEGDTLAFTIQAMGQKVGSRLDVRDDHIHAEIDLPMFLKMFAEPIRAKLQKEGPKLLE